MGGGGGILPCLNGLEKTLDLWTVMQSKHDLTGGTLFERFIKVTESDELLFSWILCQGLKEKQDKLFHFIQTVHLLTAKLIDRFLLAFRSFVTVRK